VLSRAAGRANASFCDTCPSGSTGVDRPDQSYPTETGLNSAAWADFVNFDLEALWR